MSLICTFETIEALSSLLKRGGTIAYPTEAVFGLGADPQNEVAVRRIFALKERDPSTGFLLIAAGFDQVAEYVDLEALGTGRLAEIRVTWPGPFTWIVPPSKRVPPWLTGAHAGIGVRVTAHEPTARLCLAFGGPIVSTSANPHGSPPARSVAELIRYFGARLDGILDAPLGSSLKPSSIRDAMTGRVLRA